MKSDITKNPIHLGLGASAKVEPPFTGMDWYEDYGKRNEADGLEGRLVTVHTFKEPWDMWEMHPEGSEVVLCLRGELTLIQETGSGEKRIALSSNEYAINPPGTWHTADAAGEVTALFITAGKGTEHRPR